MCRRKPETTATDGLTYRVLLTKVPPPPQTEGDELRETLQAMQIPVFKAEIPLLVAHRKVSGDDICVRDVKSDGNARRAWLAYERVDREIAHG